MKKHLNTFFAWIQQTTAWRELDYLADDVYQYMRLGNVKTGLILDQAFQRSSWRVYRWVVYLALVPLAVLSFVFILGFFMDGAMAHGRNITVAYLPERAVKPRSSGRGYKARTAKQS